MKKQPPKRDLFERLDWDDLEQWAGSRILSRGQGYQRSHRVKELVDLIFKSFIYAYCTEPGEDQRVL